MRFTGELSDPSSPNSAVGVATDQQMNVAGGASRFFSGAVMARRWLAA
jgi:hypothetical protein